MPVIIYDDANLQSEYTRRCKAKIRKLKKIHVNLFDDDLHVPIVEQITRAEINCEVLEPKLRYSEEDKALVYALERERTHLLRLYDMMMITLKSVCGERHTIEMSPERNFNDYLRRVMYADIKSSTDIVLEK